MTPNERALRKALRNTLMAVQRYADEKFLGDEDDLCVSRAAQRADKVIAAAWRTLDATAPRKQTGQPQKE